MRILHLDTGREFRGGQRQVLLLMRHLRQNGHIQAFLGLPGSPLLKHLAAEGFNTRGFGLAGIWSASTAFDLLHCHDARAHTLAAIASRRPFVVARRVGFGSGRGWADRWKYSRAAAYIAVSEYVAAQLISAGVSRKIIDVVPDGVIAPDRPSDHSGGVLALEMSDPLKAGGLLDQLRTPMTRTNDIAAHLGAAQVFLYLTQMEGLGSAALLAMAYGVPVVASRVGGLPEVVRHGETGLCVANEPGEIDRALKTLLDNPARAAAMGSRAREWVMKHCSAARVAELTEKTYNRLIR